MSPPIKRCEHPDCIAPAVGYGDRQLQGPFYCANHEAWARNVVWDFYSDLTGVDSAEVTP